LIEDKLKSYLSREEVQEIPDKKADAKQKAA
jgi:hypothetical protein